MKGLKFDTKTLKSVSAVIAEAAKGPLTDRYCVKKTVEKIGDENYSLLLDFYRASGTENAAEAAEIYNDIKNNNECIYMKELKLNGDDLKKMGVTDGKTIGMALKAALDEAHRDNSVNDAVWLANFVRDRFLI